MAKRRRLDVTASPMDIALARASGRAAPPPIAQVTGEASAMAGAQSVMDEMGRARAEGRMVVSIPLAEITQDHLVRDRLGATDEDMQALKDSIRNHGQRTPIEVVQTGSGYGLISGWRRLAALTDLLAETGEEQFARVKALIRQPRDAGEAYVAMVEENEIRVGLSYYERARIAVMAAARGAFADTEAALTALYGNVSRAKRSKIRSFVTIHDALGEALQFPAHIPERLGLKIAGALKEGRNGSLLKALAKPAATPEAEATALTRAISPEPAPKPAPETLPSGVTMEVTGQGTSRKLTLRGAALDDAMITRLRAVLDEG